MKRLGQYNTRSGKLQIIPIGTYMNSDFPPLFFAQASSKFFIYRFSSSNSSFLEGNPQVFRYLITRGFIKSSRLEFEGCEKHSLSAYFICDAFRFFQNLFPEPFSSKPVRQPEILTSSQFQYISAIKPPTTWPSPFFT